EYRRGRNRTDADCTRKLAVVAAGDAVPWRLSPGWLEQRGGSLGQIADPFAEVGEARIARLALYESGVDLLNHDGDLEEREHFEEPQRRQVAAAARSVALDEFTGCQPARQCRDRRERVPWACRCVRRPIRQQNPQIDEWIAESCHFPVQHRDET